MFVNTAQEFDGSDSGARPDEAVSWGKIKMDAKPVKVHHVRYVESVDSVIRDGLDTPIIYI